MIGSVSELSRRRSIDGTYLEVNKIGKKCLLNRKGMSVVELVGLFTVMIFFSVFAALAVDHIRHESTFDPDRHVCSKEIDGECVTWRLKTYCELYPADEENCVPNYDKIDGNVTNNSVNNTENELGELKQLLAIQDSRKLKRVRELLNKHCYQLCCKVSVRSANSVFKALSDKVNQGVF